MGPFGENRPVCLNESWFQERCSDTVTIQACLQGVNDNPPVCPNILKRYIIEQDYNGPNRRQILQINCTDADSSCPNSPATPFMYMIDSVVVYEVSDGRQLNEAEANGLFEVDSNGFLWVIGDIDREGREDVHNDEYLVHMIVTDGATPPLSTTVGVSLWQSAFRVTLPLPVLFNVVTHMVCACTVHTYMCGCGCLCVCYVWVSVCVMCEHMEFSERCSLHTILYYHVTSTAPPTCPPLLLSLMCAQPWLQQVVVVIEEVNDEPPVCPTNLRMDFNCFLSNASAAVTISEDSDTAHQVINIAALDPDLDPLLDYRIVSVIPDHFDSKFYVMLQSTMCASTCVHNVCLYVCPQCAPVRVSTMCACTCVHNACLYLCPQCGPVCVSTMCAYTCVPLEVCMLVLCQPLG